MARAAYLAFEPADENAANAIGAELERNGWALVRAEPEARQGDKPAALTEAVSAAGVVVVFASAAGARSLALRQEAQGALNNGRPLIVVQLEDFARDAWLAALDPHAFIDMRAGASSETLARLNDMARAASGGGRVIAMLNIKGGVGKTVLAANLFAAAHLANRRAVSFIDLDPQHNLTQYFLSPGERNRIREQNRTIHGILDANVDSGAAFAVPLNRARRAKGPIFDLIPGDERLFEYTLDTRPEADRAAAFTRFRALLAQLRARGDAVVIDANPCATFLTRLAITAADHIVAPVRPERYSLTGLNMLEHVVREIRGRPLRPDEFSVLLNGVNDRTRSSEMGDADALTRAEISDAPFFGAALLREEIPYSALLRSTPSERFAANPINVTAMTRVGGRPAKEALTRAAAAILARSAQ